MVEVSRWVCPQAAAPLDFATAERRYRASLRKDVPLACCNCGITGGAVTLHSSRTAYSWDGKGEDPNRPFPLCDACAEEHHAHWDDMWRTYRAGLL